MKPKKYPIKDEIVFLKADSNYTIYYLQNGEKFISSKTLKQTQANLRLTLFLRLSKSHLVNPDFINNIRREGNFFMVKLGNEIQIKVSRRKAVELRENLRKFFQ